ncbi:MAG: glycosyltransferase [Promethearchaeota archaeon]
MEFSKTLPFWFPLLQNAINKNSNIFHIHWIFNIAGFNLRNKFKSLLKFFIFIIDTLILKFILRYKIIWTIHNTYSHESFRPKMERIGRIFFSMLADQLIVHCDEAKKVIMREYKVPRNKLVVIPIGTYENLYKNNISKDQARRNLNLSEEEFVFLYFGPIRPYKGVPDLIKSYKSIEAQNKIKLIIAGKPLNERIRRNILDKIKDTKTILVDFRFIPDDKIQNYMNSADVVVFPYRKILTSAGVLLAMSFGKAIIAPSIGCLKNILNHQNAFLYSTKDSSGLTHALIESLNSPKKIKEMGNFNQNYVKAFNWEKIADKTKILYKWLDLRRIKRHNLWI